MTNLIYYAIGDIHGELARLTALHKSISEFHKTFHSNKPQIRIHLGDYIDRGPDSYDVIKYIRDLERHAAFQVISLKGNHESLMLRAYERKRLGDMQTWLDNGGDTTLSSYQKHGFDRPPKAHLDWLGQLPTRHFDEERGLVFVHAGIDPDVFPDEPDSVRLWTRSENFFDTKMWINPELSQICVVHGHTPTSTNRPDVTQDGRRINIDTGACYDGMLTAVVLAPHEKPRFIHAWDSPFF